MTQEEFLDTEWTAGARVRCRRNYPGMGEEIMEVLSVDFDQCLIATIPSENTLEAFDPYWWRCENCELVDETD